MSTYGKAPSRKTYLAAAQRVAQSRGIPLSLVIGRGFDRAAACARWELWRELSTRYSVNQIAQVGGFHHTTVLHGLGRLTRGKTRVRANA